MMDALVEYLAGLRDLRRDMPGDIPRFSDKDGRTKAKVLFLFEDPGKSGAAESGEVDRDNDDPSAKAFTEANKGVLNRETTVSWNTIPWARQEKVAQEISLVREWKLVPKLLDALPDVRVVVLCGNVAHRLTIDVYDYGADHDRDLLVLHSPHPSRRGLQSSEWFSREQRKRWLRRVIKQARDHLACLDYGKGEA
jgi:uracil-DNA glycosylase